MAKIYIETSGCSHNTADSEHMAGLIQSASHTLVYTEEEADLVLFNTCTVKTPTEHAFFNRLEEIKQKGKKIIIAGCIPQTDPEKLKEYSLIGTRQTDKIIETVNDTLIGKTIQIIQTDKTPSMSTPTIRSNPLIEIIPINLGCLGTCTYCKTKAARGHLRSYSSRDIITRARSALNEGIKEIWLTSQDTAAYGQDINTNIAELLTEICKIDKDFKIRLGMGNPDGFLKMKNRLIMAMRNEKVYKFLHIPVQSGNNDILKSMKRDYTIEQYKEIINSFRKIIPEITISTDIICGFPGETKEQFEDSVKLIQETKPDIVNVSRFWARSKTLAEKMPNQIPNEEIMKRSEHLSKIAREISLENKKKNIGKEVEVTINEKGTKENQWKARTPEYNQIILNGNYKLGNKVKVKIIDATVNDLISE